MQFLNSLVTFCALDSVEKTLTPHLLKMSTAQMLRTWQIRVELDLTFLLPPQTFEMVEYSQRYQFLSAQGSTAPNVALLAPCRVMCELSLGGRNAMTPRSLLNMLNIVGNVCGWPEAPVRSLGSPAPTINT
jgi:hypothetical protein